MEYTENVIRNTSMFIKKMKEISFSMRVTLEKMIENRENLFLI